MELLKRGGRDREKLIENLANFDGIENPIVKTTGRSLMGPLDYTGGRVHISCRCRAHTTLTNASRPISQSGANYFTRVLSGHVLHRFTSTLKGKWQICFYRAEGNRAKAELGFALAIDSFACP